MKSYAIYILASGKNGTLYIGVTNNLERRMFEHTHHVQKGFTDKYNVTRLVHFEFTSSIEAAIAREKQLKSWRRAWKIALIEATNPEWKDLADELGLDSESSSE